MKIKEKVNSGGEEEGIIDNIARKLKDIREKLYKNNTQKREKKMVSREHNRAALHEKLQLLRSITNSHAVISP